MAMMAMTMVMMIMMAIIGDDNYNRQNVGEDSAGHDCTEGGVGAAGWNKQPNISVQTPLIVATSTFGTLNCIPLPSTSSLERGS